MWEFANFNTEASSLNQCHTKRELYPNSRLVVVVEETLLPYQNVQVWEIYLTNVGTQITINNIIYTEILPTRF